MKRKKTRRGISAGTILTLFLTAAVLMTSFFVFARLTGKDGKIEIDPKLLSATLANFVSDLREEGTAEPEPSPTPVPVVRTASEPEIVFATVPDAAETEAPTIYMNSTVSINAVGQVMIGGDLRASGKQENGLYDFTDVFSPISGAVSQADLSLVTLRSTMDDGSSGYDDYCAPDTLATALKGAGFRLINLGTDRILDRGMEGLQITRAVLQQRTLSSAGAYTSEKEAEARSVVEISGVKVGILSYVTALSAAGQQEATEEEQQYGVRLYSAQRAQEDIAKLRQEGAQAVIVLINWGKRGDTEPSKETLEQADELVEAGADVILGTGPTNVHALERRLAQDGREVFIAYSLGNFLIDESRETADITGMLLHLELEWNGQQEKLGIAGAWYMPTWIMRWREDGEAQFRVVPAGSSVTPEFMTDSIYVNMKKSYQSMTDRIGSEAAAPRME